MIIQYIIGFIFFSAQREPDNLEPNQGFSLEQAVILLGRIMSLIDSLVFSGSANLAQLEADKNMPAGGILRQSLRLGMMGSRNVTQSPSHSFSCVVIGFICQRMFICW